MHRIKLTLESKTEILSLFDPLVPHFFVHRFDPKPAISWFKADLKTSNGFEIENVDVRSMQFDLLTDLKGIGKILELNTSQLSIYQFDRKLPDTLLLENLPAESRYKILQNNGLKHFFGIEFEFLIVESFDLEFIRSIEQDPLFRERIVRTNV